MVKYSSLQQNGWTSFQVDNEAYAFGADQTAAIFRAVGGVYNAVLPVYADGDAVLFQFTSAGRLMVDTELTLDGNIIVNNLGGAAVNDAPIAGNPLQSGAYAANFDGAALPGAVNAEGDVIYVKSSLSGVQYFMPVNEDGSASPLILHDTAIAAADGGTAGYMIVAEAKDFDDAAFPNVVSLEGDAVRIAASLSGVQYHMLVSESGAKTPHAVDDSAQVATPDFLNVGGEYRTAATVYTDGDATILQTDINGHLKVGVGSSVIKPAVTNASAALAIATSTTVANHFRLVCVTCRFNIAPVTSENFTVTLNANDGAAYDTVLFSVDPSATAATSVVYIPDKELLMESGDELDVAFTNTDARTYGLRIVTLVV